MRGTLSDEIEVPAREAWELYGTLKTANVTYTFDKIEVVAGDGGVGAILKLTLPADGEAKGNKQKNPEVEKPAATPPRSKMHGTFSDGIEVNVPAHEAWELYGTLKITHVTHTFDKIEVVKGDGGVGTVLKLTLPAGTTVFSSYEEKYTKIDDAKMIKEAEVISGGYLDLGFILYRTRFEIVETGKTSCITKTTIEYDVNEEDVANCTYVSILPMICMMKDVATYLLANTKS
ncbi:hypothetical protein RJ639_033949 [Escallonia herrerae]|uniref:Bet v I/Major latex protein domain-containing protein n=1 Tax=Escallonia herrerae TaxID=1293975 RepID=A0AA89BBB3_9ASTE|nr:hypothetical protein RJ639_033949 [Escallonia herrerae]